MFGFKENLKLKKQVEELTTELNNTKAVIANLNKKIADVDFVINWKEMNAFSVERMVNDNLPVTVIGYFIEEPVFNQGVDMWVPKKVVCEWYLHCNEDRHNELARQFKEYLKGKTK